MPCAGATRLPGRSRSCWGSSTTTRRWSPPASSPGPLRGRILAADPNLERPFEKTREQILHALTVFGEKATAAAARKNEVVDRRTHQLREACLPLGKPQERIVSTAHFPGKY